MRSTLTVFTFIIILSIGAVAQSTEKTVESIRKRYTDIAEKARLCETDEDQGQFGELVMNELSVNSRGHQWRAVGIFGQKFKFFYKGGDNEQHLYPDQLVFVKTERRSSNRVYHEEFLYSDAGVLLFYFQKSENDELTPTERRVYFFGPKAVRIVEDGKSRDKLTAKDLAAVKEITTSSVALVATFQRSLKL